MGSTRINSGGYDDDDEQQRAVAECDSFTFMSCSDFTSSSLRFFSDCEGDESESESYIEIELDRAGAKLDSEEEDEIELRVSISSSAPFPKLRTSSQQKRTNLGAELRSANESGAVSGFSSSFSDVGVNGKCLQEEAESGNSGDQGRGGGGGAKFAAVCRLLNAVATSLKVSPETCHEQDSSSHGMNRQFRRQELPRQNEASKKTGTRNGARVMQFLFKFRAIQFRTFLTSLVKNRPIPTKGKNLSESLGERRLQETLNFHHKMAKSTGRTLADRIASEKKAMSCPSSIKCSPINQETYANTNRSQKGECSIQAAIAHCKKSLTTSSDFTFKPHP